MILRTLPDQQRGASSVGIILLIFALIVGVKLLLAILPAQISDYQLTKLLTHELQEANTNKISAKKFIDTVNNQLAINSNYDMQAEDIFTFTNKRAGELAIHKQYAKTSHFFANVDIVNRFESDIVVNDESR